MTIAMTKALCLRRFFRPTEVFEVYNKTHLTNSLQKFEILIITLISMIEKSFSPEQLSILDELWIIDFIGERSISNFYHVSLNDEFHSKLQK